MLVGERVVGELVRGLERRRVRLVVHAHPLLFLHGLALVVELLLREDERAHAVGLEEEAEVEALGGKGLEVVRPVLGRRPVHRAARLGHEPEMLALADVLRALEHEVLEEVREPRLPGRLDAAADVVRDVHRHEGDSALRRHDDRQPVRELLDVKRNFEIEGRTDGPPRETRGAVPRNIAIVLRFLRAARGPSSPPASLPPRTDRMRP